MRVRLKQLCTVNNPFPSFKKKYVVEFPKFLFSDFLWLIHHDHSMI